MATPSTGTTGKDTERYRLLAIYLNDHLAGATGGVELAERVAGSLHGSELGAALERLRDEIREDRDALLEIMAALGVSADRVKPVAAWAAEKAGRLKLNGYLLRRSPLSTLVELEGLRLGIEGKASGWRTLRQLAEHDSRLDAGRLDALTARARRQADTVEELRVQQASKIFVGPPSEPA